MQVVKITGCRYKVFEHLSGGNNILKLKVILKGFVNDREHLGIKKSKLDYFFLFFQNNALILRIENKAKWHIHRHIIMAIITSFFMKGAVISMCL